MVVNQIFSKVFVLKITFHLIHGKFKSACKVLANTSERISSSKIFKLNPGKVLKKKRFDKIVCGQKTVSPVDAFRQKGVLYPSVL